MPFKNLEQRRRYRRQWYARNKKSEMAHVKRRKQELKKWLQEYKKNLKCSNCSENHPATLDFHHKEGEKKEKTISHFVSNGYSVEKIEKELKKCQVLCSNCHRKLHYKNNKL